MLARTTVRSVALTASLLAASAHAGPAEAVPEKNICADAASPLALGSAQWNGWGRDVENTRYQPEPAIRASDVPKLALKWAFGFQGSAVAGQPTVVDGRLFVASSAGRIYSLDAKTGCTYWTFDAPAGTRTAISIGEFAPSRSAAAPKYAAAPRRKHGGSKKSKRQYTLAHLDILKAPSAAFFGDDTGAVYALDAQRGTLLWKTVVDAHPLARIVGGPMLYRDRLYVVVASNEQSAAVDAAYSCCTFRGSVAALDIGSGRLVWKSYTVLEEPQPTRKNSAGVQEFGPAGAAIVAAPTVDPKRNVLYVATGGSATGFEQSLTDAVAAFDLSDGKLRWVKQLSVKGEVASSGFMGSAILRTLSTGNQIILAGQLSGVVYGLDPDHGGEILWQTRVAASGSTAAAATAPGAAANSGDGGIAWGGSADHRNFYVALSGLAAQPANAGGSLTALDMKTGVVRWTTPAPQPACAWTGDCSHAQAQAVTVMPGVAFSGSMDGHLRAYSTIDGKILWDFDTAKAFQTQNGVRASGGPLDRGGATVVNGSVYINSGNALLAFSVDAK